MTATRTMERRAESQRAVNELVANRTQMLALYARLATHRPFHAGGDMADLIRAFCQALVDYTAEAHFRLYRHFESNNERRTPVAQIAARIYPRIADITQAILDFNDRYDSDEKSGDVSHLEKDLSRVGEVLAERIELEDQLVAVLSQGRASRTA